MPPGRRLLRTRSRAGIINPRGGSDSRTQLVYFVRSRSLAQQPPRPRPNLTRQAQPRGARAPRIAVLSDLGSVSGLTDGQCRDARRNENTFLGSGH